MRFLAVLLAAATCSAGPPDRTVVLVSIDGFPAFAFDDPRLPVPNLKKLARDGAVAARMQPVDPTVTWPNHTSMVTGVAPAVHSVLYNGLAVREPGTVNVRIEPWRDKTELVQATTIYDVAHKAGLTTAEVDWVAVFNASTITWSFAEVPKADGAIEKEMIAAGLITAEDIAQFRDAGITWRDEIWTKAAIYILEQHKPNLLLFHLLNTDSVQHRYGPRTLAAASALALADMRVGQLIHSLERSKRLDRTTFFIVSDHGFKTVTKQIRPNALLGRKGLAKDVVVIPEGGTAMVYGAAPGLKELLGGIEGVERVLDPAEYAALKPGARVPDLVLAAKSGYSFSAARDGEVIVEQKEPSGSHGYVNSDPDMGAIFIASGAGIRRGVRLAEVRTLDIAPTIAALLGLKLENVQGQVLTGILTAP